MNLFLFIRQFDSFNLLEFFDPALYLSGFGGLIAEAIDECLQMVNVLLLVAMSRCELGTAFRFLLEVAVVIAGVEIGVTIPDFQNFVHRHVEKIAVV